MQQKMTKYVASYKATVVKVKQESVVCYSWIQLIYNSIKVIQNIENKLIVEGYRVK